MQWNLVYGWKGFITFSNFLPFLGLSNKKGQGEKEGHIGFRVDPVGVSLSMVNINIFSYMLPLVQEIS